MESRTVSGVRKEDLNLRKSRKLVLLMLPLLLAFVFQATQYARAPMEYGYYVVYAENADIALRPGTDRSPEGQNLLQNSTQYGLYNLTLGRWGPGYHVNYTDAFHIKNNEAFNISLICLNFSHWQGTEYLSIFLRNDTNGDGNPDGDWVAAWYGAQNRPPSNPVGNQLNSTYHIFFVSQADLPVKIEIEIFHAGIGLANSHPSIFYEGTMYLWFTSVSF